MARRETQFKQSVIRLDSTPKRDFTIADRDDDDEDEISLEIDEHVGAEEEEYDNEFGYWIVKMLRGSTLGRQIKRELFKLSIYHFLWGFIVFIISIYQAVDIGRLNGYFFEDAHGGSIIEMQFVTSLGALIITGFTWLSMQFWASLVTNRELLGGLLKLYQLLLILHFAIVLWSINALGATFEDTDWRTEEAAVKKIYPSYCATIIVTAFYLPILIYYGLNISYYCETMLKTGGVIEEPDVDPDEVYDLSDYTLLQFLLMPLAIPILIMIKLKEAIEECLYHTKRWIDHRRAIYEASQKKRKSIGHRIKKTFKKWYKYLKEMISPVKPQSQPAVVVPVSPSSLSELRSLNAAIDADLAPPETEAEKAERIQEEERKKEEERVAKAKEAADRKQREKEEELRKKMEEERKKQEEQQAKLDEEERIRKERETAAVLSKDMYKEYWGSMKPAGSFQCKLKVPPNVDKFAEHLAKQGFHVVFSQNTNSAAECEVGICNIRGDGEPGTGTGPWFLARFVAGKNAFSAVMKCEDAAIVTTFVKKFALAKILKIDTSS